VKKNPILCHSGKGGNKIENKKYRNIEISKYETQE
jgi:hypothetical protein